MGRRAGSQPNTKPASTNGGAANAVNVEVRKSALIKRYDAGAGIALGPRSVCTEGIAADVENAVDRRFVLMTGVAPTARPVVVLKFAFTKGDDASARSAGAHKSALTRSAAVPARSVWAHRSASIASFAAGAKNALFERKSCYALTTTLAFNATNAGSRGSVPTTWNAARATSAGATPAAKACSLHGVCLWFHDSFSSSVRGWTWCCRLKDIPHFQKCHGSALPSVFGAAVWSFLSLPLPCALLSCYTCTTLSTLRSALVYPALTPPFALSCAHPPCSPLTSSQRG